MSALRMDLSHTEKPRHIQENLMAYMRLFAGLPGFTVYDAESFWIISKRPAPGNSIFCARWPADESDEQIEARLDDLYQQIGQHLDEIDWLMFPGDTPPNLGQRLLARGQPSGLGGNWLWADLQSLGTGPAMPDNFRIELVQDDAMLMEWLKASEAGFEMELGCYYDAYARHGYGPDAFSLHYIGYLDDTPVTSGTLLDFGGGASIYDVSTPPAFRRLGFGGALTHAMMWEMRQRGHTDTWVWSSNMAKHLYQELGYVDADFGVREYTWTK